MWLISWIVHRGCLLFSVEYRTEQRYAYVSQQNTIWLTAESQLVYQCKKIFNVSATEHCIPIRYYDGLEHIAEFIKKSNCKFTNSLVVHHFDFEVVQLAFTELFSFVIILMFVLYCLSYIHTLSQKTRQCWQAVTSTSMGQFWWFSVISISTLSELICIFNFPCTFTLS